MPITEEQADKLFAKILWDEQIRDIIPNTEATWATLGVKPDRNIRGLKRIGRLKPLPALIVTIAVRSKGA